MQPSLLAVILALGACTPPHAPADVAQAWLDAVARERSAEAWARMADEPRRDLREADLAARLQRLPPDDRERIEAAPTAPVIRTAEWPTELGPLRFEHRGGNRWVLVGPLPRFERQDTPARTLTTFERALRHEDYELMLRLAPPAEREGLTAETLRARFADPRLRDDVRAAVSALRDTPGEALSPTHWRISSGRHQADLVLIEDQWFLADIR